MSLFKGSLTYARYFVDPEESEPLESGFADRFLEQLAARPFEPLDPDQDLIERAGFCRVGEPFETTFSYQDLFWNGHLVLGFRVDRWVVPPALVKAKAREAESSFLQRKGRERATKKEKAELKELVTKKLRKQLAPSTRVVDLAVSLDDGVARFFSHSSQLGGTMCDLVQSMLGLRLVPEAPYTTAARVGLDALVAKGEGDAAWEALEQTDLSVVGGMVAARGGR